MWSKQAVPQDVARSNKNCTSFRNRITNKKQKSGKGKQSDSAVDSEKQEAEDKSETKKKPAGQPQQPVDVQQKTGGRNRNRNRNKNGKTSNRTVENTQNKSVSEKPADLPNDVTLVIEKKVEEPDVVLRNGTDKQRNISNAVKRYSDSFVIENGVVQSEAEKKIEKNGPPTLTRAVSGFFVVDHTKKTRRFSDLFRPSSTLKLAGSTESLKVEKLDVPLSKDYKNVANNNVKNSKKAEKVCSKTVTTNSTTLPKKSASVSTTETSNSYLKRVKSKIYKSKSDDASKIELDKNKKAKAAKKSLGSIIPENEVAILTPPGLAKSLANFDFRLIRQSSNLERGRSAKSIPESADVVDFAVPADRPLLAKAKSSSAINLNLLRTRRCKILEQVAARKQAAAAMNVRDEFDFIAFGSMGKLNGSQTSLNKCPSWLHLNKSHPYCIAEEKGDSKGGQPVSRSGSDRRPDSVKEEQQQGGGGAGSANGSGGGAKESNGGSPLGGSGDRGDELQGGPAHGVNERGEPAGSDSSVSLPASGNRKKIGSNINRSESWKEQSEKRKQKRNISDPSHNASCDVELEKQQGLSNTDSGSSSHSSLSCNGRLSESPCTSAEVVHQAAAHARTRSDTDSDADGETEPLNWQERVPEEELRKLNQLELKRQEVINELFSTEGSHVRSLKVLYRTFYKRLSQSQLLKPDELALIFPNIKELLDVHQEINDEMRRKRRDDPIVKELGDLMVKTFCGPTGETIRRASATFCQRQRLALEFITKRRERDTKFDALLADCEKKRACRRLPLQGILPTQMQRLSKYPLLLERLIGTVENGSEEEDKLRKAHDLSKEILQHVNEAAKVAMNQHRLEDIQRRLDTSAVTGELRALDLTCHRLVLEGGMQLRRPNKAPVPVHVLLLEEMVVILHRDGDRFLLKLFQSGSSAQPQPLSPIIKMNTLLVRNNAVCKNALFLFNTSTTNNQPPTMYDLVAENESKREEWFKNFSEAAEAYTHREGGKPGRRATPAPSTSSTASAEVADSPTASEEEPEPRPPDAHQPDTVAVQKEGGAKGGEEDKTARDSSTDELDQNESEGGGAMVASGVSSGGDVVRQSRVAADDWPLVQPSQLSVSAPDVHTAERMLTPLEQIRRKDALVKQALADKEGLVADLLSIPREHYHHIADMASDMTLASSRDITERVMASIFQVDQLQKAVNAALNVTEAEAVEAKGGKVPSCASQNIPEKPTVPSVPAGIVRDIAASLSSQLTTLLSDVKQIEEERDRLRREICKFRELLHEEHNLHGPPPTLQEESEEANNNGNEATESTETPEVEKVSGGNEKDDVFYETSGDNQ